MSSWRKGVAEALGTFWLVFASVGSAVIAGDKIGNLGIALAFGLSVLTMVYAVGHISGAHLNPAVSVGLAVAGRIPARVLPTYIIAQLFGSFFGAWGVLAVAQATAVSYDPRISGLGANGYGLHSPGGYSAGATFFFEVVMTFIFLVVILGATSKRGINTFAGIAVGLCLTLIHLVGIPVDNLSVNPARSTGPAIFVGGWAVNQLWLFWIAPLVGAALAGLFERALDPEELSRRGPPGPPERVREVP